MNLTASPYLQAPDGKLSEIRAKRFVVFRDAETQTLYRESSARATSSAFIDVRSSNNSVGESRTISQPAVVLKLAQIET